MRRKKLLIISTAILAAVIFLVYIFSYKYRIFNIVRGNIDLLNNSVQSGSYDRSNKIWGVKEISEYPCTDGGTVVDYFCFGSGLVPSSVYCGFYYSSDGDPAGFQGVDNELIREDKGWTWLMADGDNGYYTEQISGSWYYYKAWF